MGLPRVRGDHPAGGKRQTAEPALAPYPHRPSDSWCLLPASSVPAWVIGDGQLGQGLLQVSARIGYVLCHRARPSPQMLGDHPVRPSFMKLSDKRLYVVSPAFRRSPSVSVPTCTVSGRRARRPAAPRPRLLSTRLAVPASDAGTHRSLCGWLPRTATLASSQAGNRPSCPTAKQQA